MNGERRTRAACTIVAKSTLALGRVVAESFRNHHPEVPFFLLLADEVDGHFDPAGEPYDLITLAELEYSQTRALAFRYTQQEFSYSLTPTLLLHLLRRGFREVLFIKQESLVTAPLTPEFEVLETASMVLTPHLLRPLTGTDAVGRELNILLSGVYNGGFIGVNAAAEAVSFLEWWQDRLRFHCLHQVGVGMHFEQRWLDLAPAFIRNVSVSRDPGLNVGHWNLLERHVLVKCGYITADGQPCRLFRFSGFDRERPERVTRYSDRLTTSNIGTAAEVFRRYADLLDSAGYEQLKLWPYAFDRFSNGAAIPMIARAMYRALPDSEARFDDPFHTFLKWLAEGSGVNRLLMHIHKQRPDLQQAFPDPMTRDRESFTAWARTFGVREYDLPAELLPA